MEMLASGNMKMTGWKALNDTYQAFQFYFLLSHMHSDSLNSLTGEKAYRNMGSFLFPIIIYET